MLTPDDLAPTDGRTPHERFDCRAEIRTFLTRLAADRSLEAVCGLGSVDLERRFEVVISPQDRYVGLGATRADYWTDWFPKGLSNVLAFIDPDIGFETRTQRGVNWVRHAEIERVLDDLPDSGGVIVYQHRPHRRWEEVFLELRGRLHYAPFAAAVFEANLAFVMLAKTRESANRLRAAARSYVANKRSVEYTALKRSQFLPKVRPGVLAHSDGNTTAGEPGATSGR